MKIISHRGNINGKVLDKENKPSYLDSAIFSKIELGNLLSIQEAVKYFLPLGKAGAALNARRIPFDILFFY